MASVVAGRYRLDERIGQGGAGEVWRAVDQETSRIVALKLLHPWVVDDPDARMRFRREAAAMVRLRHPHIVQIFGFDDDTDRPFLVQELCGGGTLATMTAAAPLRWDRVRSFALPIAEALAHAHEAGVVHRDLKPSNVLFAAGGRLVVADFGLARIIADADGTITTSGQRLGSPEYWSPEQAAGEPVTDRSDLYSLGCVLFQLATGLLPFHGVDRLAAGYRRVHEEAPPPSSINPSAVEGDDLIRRLLARIPSERPAARQIVGELSGDPAATAVLGSTTARDVDGEAAGAVTLPLGGIDPAPGSAISGVLVEPAATARMAPVVAPTIAVAPPRPPAAPARADPVVQPPAAARGPTRTGLARFGLVLAALSAIGLATATLVAPRVGMARSGLRLPRHSAPLDARGALGLLTGMGTASLAGLLLAVFAARASTTARHALTRWLSALLAIVLAAVTAAAVVWVVHATISAHPSELWRIARR